MAGSKLSIHKKTKKLQVTRRTALGGTIIYLALLLFALVSPSLGIDPLVLLLILAPFMALAISVFIAALIGKGFIDDPDAKKERLTKSPIAKVIAWLLIASLIASGYLAIKSLQIFPGEIHKNKFVYENFSTSLLFSGIALTLALSCLQRDVYWFARKSNTNLDERQRLIRFDVLQSSYKWGLALTAFVLLFVYQKIVTYVPEYLTGSHYQHVPGHFWFPAICLLVGLAALPLVIATLGRKR